MIKWTTIVTRSIYFDGRQSQCNPSGPQLISTNNRDQQWHSGTIGWLFTLIAGGGVGILRSEKLSDRYFFICFVFVAKVVLVHGAAAGS